MGLQPWVDLLTVTALFVVRIGMPIVGTLAFGYWLERKLRLREETQRASGAATGRRVIRSGNVIKVHCWDVKRCAATRRAQCAAYKRPDLPCWLALQAEGEKVHPGCFTCVFYKPQTKAA